MTNPLPDLARLAYKEHESDDHPDGGYCLQLDSESKLGSWLILVGQYQHAFGLLADAAERESDNSWALSRPILFAAHHLCELALKLVIAADDPAAVPAVHPLPELRQKASRLDSRLAPDELKWIADFIGLMNELTHKGFEGRYIEIDSEWCCLTCPTLRTSAGAFVALCVLAASESPAG